MAPRRPLSSSSATAKSNSRSDTSAFRPHATTTPAARDSGSLSHHREEKKQPQSKILKRTQRRDAFMSRIAKRASPLKVAKKRRRSSQKLATTLSGLADALPDPTATSTNQSRGSDAIELAGSGPVRIRNASLKSRAGAQKKRAALETHEREWFSRNLASMSTMNQSAKPSPSKPQSAASGQSPWEALKSHVAGNLQKTSQSEGK